MGPEVIERYWWKVAKRGPDECWEWVGGVGSHGYGVAYVGTVNGKSKLMTTHRLAWVLTNCDPGALCVCHKCDNKRCCNPGHLFLGTHKDNADDRQAKGRGNQPKGEKTHKAKLTEQDVRDIRANAALCRVTPSELGERWGVTECTIRNVVSRKTWAHV